MTGVQTCALPISYHGADETGVTSLFPTKFRDFPEPDPTSAGIDVADRVLVAPYNDLAATRAIIEAHGPEIAAVIVEPLQRCTPPLEGFLEGLRAVTAEHGVLLIFDEVVTGFRLAYGGAQEYYGVIPDLCCMGKIMGGGYPLAVVMGRRDILSVYDSAAADTDSFVSQIGTRVRIAVGCAAGLATWVELG